LIWQNLFWPKENPIVDSSEIAVLENTQFWGENFIFANSSFFDAATRN
jgi:hypothetical protein